MNILKALFKGKSDLDKQLDMVMSVEGQISRAEVKKLMELAGNAAKGTVIVEVGSYRGRSTLALAYGSLSGNSNRVYAIDPHVEFTGVLGGQFGPRDQAELYSNLVKAGVGDIVAVISLSSLMVAKSWTESNVGLLWIDGDHNYEAVRADFESWRPFIVEGGIVAFHDIQILGVKLLISELIEQGRILPLGEVELLSWFSIGDKNA